MERETGTNAPVFSSGLPGYLKGRSVTAPLVYQPEKLREMIERGRVPQPGSHEFAMLVMEDPLNMGLAYLPVLESMLGGKQHPRAETVADWMGPFAQLVVEFVTGTDLRTGEQIGGVGDLGMSFAQEFTNPRPAQSMKALIQLYSTQGDARSAADLALRYKVGRDFFGLDNLAAELLGEQPKSIPSPPGGKLYPVDPLDIGLGQREEATELYETRKRRNKRLAK